jgi:glycine cleavage system aminomethyltransferase T
MRRGTRVKPGTLRFRYDGREYLGQPGDTAASALLASGVRYFGRSVKYRRLRGLLGAGAEEPNGLFTVGTHPAVVPNVPAPTLVLQEGHVLSSQNRWPTLALDFASLLQAGGGFFGAGFYYKTFIWPKWRTYEPLIRRLAGLGAAPGACELPPAAVAERGARILHDTALVGGSGGQLVLHATPSSAARVAAGGSTLYRVRPRSFVAATGAVERPIAFIDNDRPGVMLLGAAERYLARYGLRAGREAVLFANHDRVYAAAARLAAGGLRILAIVDTRHEVGESSGARSARAELQKSGTECLVGHAVIATEGRRQVRAVRVAPLVTSETVAAGAERRIACDLLLQSGGWSPSVQALLQEGGAREYSAALGAFLATAQPHWRLVAGAANGRFELGAVLAEGHAAGAQAARHAGYSMEDTPPAEGRGDATPQLVPFWRSPAPARLEKRQFVDLQNDVTVADLRAAIAEGFTDIEHIKRYTTLGIGTEQGATSGVLGAALVAELKGEILDAAGISRQRAPFQPVALQSLAGLRIGPAFRIARRTPLHEWHAAHGGVLETSGLWMRPRYYRSNGEDAFTAAIAEARRVRASGGIVDASTLGKIEIVGADAAAFLDAMYLARAGTIKIGRSKYMVNLREDGMVLDDGLVLRLAENRFFATTSSGHAEHMLSHFEHYRDTEWGGRAVTLTDVTDAWAVIAVAGPLSRLTLQSVLGSDWHDRLASLRHMDFADALIEGRQLRVLRASFSGELAFEVHCRPHIAPALWQALVKAGLPPYGLEALDILRVEKGYLVSSELNGETTPHDLLMDGLVELGNPCLGRELLDRPGLHESSRPRLVGIRAADGRSKFLAGGQLTTPEAPNHPAGHITSAVYSPALGEWIGLALLARRLGEGARVMARDPLRGGDTPIRVVPHVHFDPDGERMKI